MAITNGEVPKTSIEHHEAMPKAEHVRAKKLPAHSAAQLAQESCEEMIQNLKRNIGEHTTSPAL